jgi:glucose dehydrogenase
MVTGYLPINDTGTKMMPLTKGSWLPDMTSNTAPLGVAAADTEAAGHEAFRAFDAETGEELWATELEASAHATPVTYLGKRSRKQFVAIAAGGGAGQDVEEREALQRALLGAAAYKLIGSAKE